MQNAPARPLTPAEKKAPSISLLKAQAAAGKNAVEAYIKDVQAKERDACAKLEAKIQSAEKAVEQAQEHLSVCRIELRARKALGEQAILQAEKTELAWMAKADAKVQASQELLDKIHQEETTLDAFPSGESG